MFFHGTQLSCIDSLWWPEGDQSSTDVYDGLRPGGGRLSPLIDCKDVKMSTT